MQHRGNFGAAIVADGERFLASAPKAHGPNAAEAGRVFVYQADGTLLFALDAPTPEKGAGFGTAIVVSDASNVIAVSAPGTASGGTVFLYNAETFSFLGAIDSPAGPKNPHGWGAQASQVSIDGNWIAVGAPLDDSTGAKGGRVDLYDLAGGNFPAPEVSLFAPNPEDFRDFGSSVALEGEHVLVSALGVYGALEATYQFRRVQGEWSPTPNHGTVLKSGPNPGGESPRNRVPGDAGAHRPSVENSRAGALAGGQQGLPGTTGNQQFAFGGQRQRVAPAADGEFTPLGGLINSGSFTASISPSGDVDAYPFEVAQGETVHLRMADINDTGLSPQVNVYAPDGTLVSWSWSTTVAGVDFVASATGTYTLVVKDRYLVGTGTYEVHYEISFVRQ